jgi:sugar phosphate isomerase/epimerase
MFQLGFVSAILANSTFEEVIDFASQNGFSHVEMMAWPSTGNDERRYAGVTHIDTQTLSSKQATYIQNYCKQKSVSISALGYYPNPLDADLSLRNQYIAHILALIEAAKLLNIGLVNTFIGRNKNLNLSQNIELYHQVWPPILAHAAKHGVRIGIENCPMYFTNDEWPDGKNIAFNAKVWDVLFDTPNGECLGLNYDPSHLLWMQMDYLAPLSSHQHKLFHLHLKDAHVDTDKLKLLGVLATPLEYHSPKLPGRGQIDWQIYLSKLKQINYQGPLIIEFEDKDYEHSTQAITEGLLFTKNYLQNIINNL